MYLTNRVNQQRAESRPTFNFCGEITFKTLTDPFTNSEQMR